MRERLRIVVFTAVLLAGLTPARAQTGFSGSATSAHPATVSPPPGAMPRPPTTPNINAPTGSPAWSQADPTLRVDPSPSQQAIPAPRMPSGGARPEISVPSNLLSVPTVGARPLPRSKEAEKAKTRMKAASPMDSFSVCMRLWQPGLTMTRREWASSCQATLSPR